MHPGIFCIIIIPLLEMRRSILIGISTVGGQTNFYTKLIRLRDRNGDPVFLTYVHSLICERCIRSQHPHKCRHMLHEIPPWKSGEKLELSELLFEIEGRTEDMMQESMYVSTLLGL